MAASISHPIPLYSAQPNNLGYVYLQSGLGHYCPSPAQPASYMTHSQANLVSSVPIQLAQDYQTRRLLLCCDSTGDLYPVTQQPSSTTTFALLSLSPTTWHRRLGHPSEDVLRRLESSHFISYNKTKLPALCHACQLGKHTRLPFYSSESNVGSVFDIIHSDLWTSPISSESGIKYYAIFLDHFSHYVWVYPLLHKSDLFDTFVTFRAYVNKQFNVDIKALQCDHGGEYDNTRFHNLFRQNGMQFRFSCPKTSQQNGKSERMLRTLNNITRTLLFQAHIPPSYWVEALNMAAHLLNILPSTAINNEIPFTKLHNKPPTYDHLRVFGCLCYPHISFDHKLQPSAKARISKPLARMNCHATTTSPIPRSHLHALRDPNWHKAMVDEHNALISNGTWALVPRPANVNIVRSMWLFKHKFNADGSLSSPVVKPDTIRTILSLVMTRDWPIHQLDVKNAFLYGQLSETVYMHQPPGFVDSAHPDYVCHLQRSLYGLKQAHRAWFQRFSSFIRRVGFQHSKTDTSLFVYHIGSDVAYLLLYVDDIILTTSSTALLQCIITLLHSEFAMTGLSSLNYFLGVSAQRSKSGLFLSQSKFAEEILERAHIQHSNPCKTPVDTESKLGSDGDPVSDPTLYRSLAGALQYLTFTRPDISYAMQQICLYMHDPLVNSLLIQMLIRLVALLLVTLSRSSAEVEYRGVANVVAETAWIWNLLLELHTRLSTASLAYCNNVSAVYLSINLVQHQRTKHIEIDIHFVREYVASGQVRVLHVPSRFQYANIFTKGLPTALFLEFRSNLNVRRSPAHTEGEY
ncbi:ribonuclease H-like domain-containing protein [Tanacetum coccineum]